MCNSVLVDTTRREILRLIAGTEVMSRNLETALLEGEPIPEGWAARIKVESTGDVILSIQNPVSKYYYMHAPIANLNETSGEILKERVHEAILRNTPFRPKDPQW